MRYRGYHFVQLASVVATLLILLLCGGAVRFAWQYFDANSWVNHTMGVIEEIRTARAVLPGTSVLSGDALRLKIATIREQFGRVEEMTRGNPRQHSSAAEFDAIFAPGLQDEIPRSPVIGSQAIAAANAVLERMQQEEYRLLTDRIDVQSSAIRNAAVAACSLCAALLVLGLVTGIAARAEFRKRGIAELALLRDKEELTRHAGELALISAGSELIQAARDEAQVNEAVAQVIRDLLPDSRGYFGLVSPSKDLVEICSQWGDGEQPQPFEPSECLALQLGKPVHRSESALHVNCTHVHRCRADYACIPVRSAAGNLGILHAEVPAELSARHADVMGVFAAHIGLGLTNLRMREALRRQTVRDSLTGLFNRRYFDETLRREVAAAARHRSPLSVLMLDVDHFKQLNDTHGHAAGDDALRTLAAILRSSFRETDLLCRYGGEEFAVILPDAAIEDAYRRAEAFRERVAEAELTSDGRSLGRMTTSVGVAAFADFAAPEELVRAADAALYRAKRMGRNATWLSGESGAAIRELASMRVRARADRPGVSGLADVAI